VGAAFPTDGELAAERRFAAPAGGEREAGVLDERRKRNLQAHGRHLG
jgi:hypothetical protein